MPAPKGHPPYNTKGEGGRPIVHDMDQIAIDMIEWVKKEESLNLNGFCGWHEPPIPPQKLGEFARSSERFQAVLNIVKGVLAERRELRVSQGLLHQKAYDLNAKVYDSFIKEEWRESIAYENELKAKATNSTYTPEQLQQLKELMGLFSNTQSQPDLKIEDNKISDEHKS